MHKNDQNRNNNNQRWIEIPAFVNGNNEASQKSVNIKRSSYEFDNSNSFVKEVNSSLARQVSEDLDHRTRRNSTPGKKNRRKKKKLSTRILRGILITLLTLSALGCLLVFTPGGKMLIARVATEYIYHNLDYQASASAKPSKGTTPVSNTEPTDKIVNILLIGIEQIQNAKNTDSMIIATMNTQTHTLKLTSLMRDLYVDIPGHGKGRLNSVYGRQNGGINLLYDTIQTNFGIKIDGYCMVNFKAFQQIVDLVGGVDVTLTSNEAQYLNSTNYISNKQYRTVKEGTQTLNGNQALGYCRVRKRSTSTESNDFGRTQRQRIVIKAIYSKVKQKNVFELVSLMNKVLKDIPVQTDITKAEFERYLEEALNLKVKDLESLRIPTDGSYQNVTAWLGSVRQEVLEPTDWNATRKQIYDFVYGTAVGTETQKDNATASGQTADAGSTTK